MVASRQYVDQCIMHESRVLLSCELAHQFIFLLVDKLHPFLG